MDYTFSYHFEPVGQGLFAWGCIYERDSQTLRFTWVFDCGTTSKRDHLIAAIDRHERRLGNRPQIDLLTISHFDGDHISGVGELIRKFHIGTLLLPYTDLRQRLIYAFEHGVSPDSNLMDFYLDPTAYLTGLDGPGIDQILIVRPGDGDGPPMPEGNPEVPGDGEFPRLKFEIERLEDLKASPDEIVAAQTSAGRQTRVEYLRRSSTLLLPNLWEFVPYNEDPTEEISQVFAASVESAKTHLLAPNSNVTREVLLNQLKDVYDAEFGDDAYERNVISLSLYSGPIYQSWKRVLLLHYYPINFNRAVVRARIWRGSPPVGAGNRCSILYTGDGYLDSPPRLDSFANFFRSPRIGHVGVFQVMHHGAEDNWHKGVAARIAPLFSVFSSDPEHKKYKHPHAPVLHDFWRYGAVQVDKQNGFACAGRLIR